MSKVSEFWDHFNCSPPYSFKNIYILLTILSIYTYTYTYTHIHIHIYIHIHIHIHKTILRLFWDILTFWTIIHVPKKSKPLIIRKETCDVYLSCIYVAYYIIMLKISNFPKNVAYLDSYVEFFFFGFLQTDHFGTCLKTSNNIILPYILTPTFA